MILCLRSAFLKHPQHQLFEQRKYLTFSSLLFFVIYTRITLPPLWSLWVSSEMGLLIWVMEVLSRQPWVFKWWHIFMPPLPKGVSQLPLQFLKSQANVRMSILELKKKKQKNRIKKKSFIIFHLIIYFYYCTHIICTHAYSNYHLCICYH